MISRLRFPGTQDSGSTSTSKSIFGNIGLSNTGNSSTPLHDDEKQSQNFGIEDSTNSASEINEDADKDNDSELPLGWRLVSSRHSGREYYLHIATGHTQWERPTLSEVSKPNVQQKQTVFSSGSVFTNGVSRMGAGLTSMFSQANTKLQTTLHNNVGAAIRNPASKMSSASGRDELVLIEIFENERVDGKSLQSSDPKHFSDRQALPISGYDTLPDGDLPDGHGWATDWEIDKNYTSVDRDGWTYAADFKEINKLLEDDLSHASCHPSDSVRRRRWIRYYQPCQDLLSSTAPFGSPDSSRTALSSSNSWLNEPSAIEGSLQSTRFSTTDDDDPFSRTAQKQQSGFRMNIKFAHRGGKDTTKDYQSISLPDITWLVTERDKIKGPTDDILREKTADLEERIKDATNESVLLEKRLRERYDSKSEQISIQQAKLDALVDQYKKCRDDTDVLQTAVEAHKKRVEELRKEANEKDILQNEEQRAMNAELEATNQALEEKAKALATARLRYKRDNKALQSAIEDAKQKLDQLSAKSNGDSQDPAAQDLKKDMEKLRLLHSKLETMREHRLALEQENKTLFNVVVEKKADLKFKSKKKMETALKDIDGKIRKLKEEQAALAKRYSEKPVSDELRQLNSRRNSIRSDLGALKERRAMLMAEKRKLENAE